MAKTEDQQMASWTKVLIMGNSSTGRTSLLHSYLEGSFPDEKISNSSYPNTYFHKVDINGEKELIYVCPTDGHEIYDNLMTISYQHTDVVVLCYSIDDPSSLQSVMTKWRLDLSKHCPLVPVILVATKKDLRHMAANQNQSDATQRHLVSASEGSRASKAIGAYAFIECSAKTGEGVENVFVTATKASLVDKNTHSISYDDKSESLFCRCLCCPIVLGTIGYTIRY